MQSKENIHRSDLTENQLKKIVIRFDYTGVTIIDSWVEQIKKTLVLDKFGKYLKSVRNNAKIDFSNTDQIAQSLSVPIAELNSEPVHVFFQSSF